MFAWGIYNAVSALFNLYEILIVVWCILSWIPKRPDTFLWDISSAVNRVVQPYIDLFRRFIPPFGGIDFSPVVAILALSVIEMVVLRLLVFIL